MSAGNEEASVDVKTAQHTIPLLQRKQVYLERQSKLGLDVYLHSLSPLHACRKALEAWPQYSKHIIVDRRGKYHVHLNVFEYFVFWTAFYVLRSSQSGGCLPQPAPKGYSSLAPSFGTVRKVRLLSGSVIEHAQYDAILHAP